MHIHMYLYIMYPSSFLMSTSAKESILGTCSRKNEHGHLGIKVKTSTFSQNGSPGQTTMLIGFVSKFWVKPQSPFPRSPTTTPKP